jgi:thioredoxin reductase
MDARTGRYCVLGAGAAGLVMSRRLLEAGVEFDALDAASRVGGLWASSPAHGPLYRNTHLISPKSLQGFVDFPMPASYPDFPHHSFVLDYLERYAAHFNLLPHLEFGARVMRVEPDGDNWKVALAGGETRAYRGVLVATGKHEIPELPAFPGRFDGLIRHSRDYCDAASLRGLRVLVVGAGQSAIDLVAESAVVADRTFHSTRRGLFSMPRYLLGKPFEEHLQSDLPLHDLGVRLSLPLLKLLGKAPAGCHLPPVDFREGVIHPTVGREFFRFYQQGDVTVKPGIAELCGNAVRFTDGTTEEIDAIYCATGYRLDYPFIDRQFLNWPELSPRPDLYLYTFPPDSDSLVVLGMMQPLGAHWTAYDEQAQLVTAFLQLRERGGARLEEFRRRRRMERPRLDGGIDFYRAAKKPIADLDKISFRHHARQLRQWMRN